MSAYPCPSNESTEVNAGRRGERSIKIPESSVDVDNQFNQLSNVASLAQCDWNRNKCHWMDDVKDDSLQR